MTTATKKSKAAEQLPLDSDWQDKVPKPVQSAADEYTAALVAKAKLHGKFNTTKDNLIALMEEHHCPKVRVQYKDSEKVIELQDLKKLKLRKPQAATRDEDEDDEDES